MQEGDGQMKPDTVFVYLGDGEKEVVKRVANQLDLSQSRLFHAISMPQVRKLDQALKRGTNPVLLRKLVTNRSIGPK